MHFLTNPFPTFEPVYFAYFFYSASFLFLAFSIGTKNLEASNLRIAEGLGMLALFGLGQGLRELIAIYPLIEGEHLTPRVIFDIEIITTATLLSSYLFLLHFGLLLIEQDRKKRRKIILFLYPLLVIASILFLEWEGITTSLSVARVVQIAARNVFGFTAGLLTAYGMIRYSFSREIRNLTYFISRNFFYAGIVFGVYAFLTTSVFGDLTRDIDIPKEGFRAGAASLIAFFIIRALNIFDVELRIRAANQARALVEAERLASLGKLAAGIAHEINNPLTNASLGLQIARRKLEKSDPAAISDHLSRVEKSIDRAASIAQELLLFSRDRETEFGPVNVNEVVQAALNQLQHRLAGIRIEATLPSVPSIRGDRGKLEQVFINILSNAREAMPQGGTIFVAGALSGDMVEINVIDTGSGIQPDVLAKVFDPFFTTKEVGAGTGLGLYISYGIVKQHHGTIGISSELGKGTTVSVRLPVAAV